jgi:porphobilinogen synthase
MAIKFGRPLERKIGFVPVEQEAREATDSAPLDLAIRMRRNRRAEWARRMVREHVLTTDDLIWPLFVNDGNNTPVPSMPGVQRLSIDGVVREAEKAAKLTIPCIALFPYTNPGLRDDTGSEALNPTISSAAPFAPSRKKCRRSEFCATSRSIPSPAMATMDFCVTASSSMTRRSPRW